jgi:Flp pilus assembly protein TadG
MNTAMKKSSRRNHPRERGVILFVYTVAMGMIVLVLGLAIDAGVLYMTRNRMQAASDAAALAAARSLNISQTQSGQESDAQLAATSFFTANFPNSTLGTMGSAITTSLTYGAGAQAATASLTTIATTNAPTYFMKWLGYSTIPITVTGTASRRDINMIMVLDRSGSMNNAQVPTACEQMKIAATSFVDMFSNGRDTLGLVVFNSGAETAFEPSTNFNAGMKAAISGISCGGNTATANALFKAYGKLLTIGDGVAQSVTADFPKYTGNGGAIRWGDGSGAYPNTDVLYNFPTSTCTANTITGTLSGGNNSLNGGTNGLRNPDLIDMSLASGGNGCFYQTDISWVRRDIAFIPDTDSHGNSTRGHRLDWDPTTSSYNPGQDTFVNGPQGGMLRPDQPRTLLNVAYNATESQGITIRNNNSLNPMIVTIGLGGNGGVDDELLVRLANVPSATGSGGTNITNGIYDMNKLQGLYTYSPSQYDLQSAFSKVGSFVVELTK